VSTTDILQTHRAITGAGTNPMPSFLPDELLCPNTPRHPSPKPSDSELWRGSRQRWSPKPRYSEFWRSSRQSRVSLEPCVVMKKISPRVLSGWTTMQTLRTKSRSTVRSKYARQSHIDASQGEVDTSEPTSLPLLPSLTPISNCGKHTGSTSAS
jgi:hypothetical protein